LKNKEPYLSLYKMLGFCPTQIELYQQAFVHCSITPKQYGKDSNNERLEFLGDAVLDAVIADIVFHHFPHRREGFLTNTRSKIVKRETMNQVALELGIDEKMVAMPYAAMHHKYMYGNALEALIGAIYLDKGYKYCLKFVESKIIDRFILLDKLANQEVNFKSRLLEWSAKMHLTTEFEVTDERYDEVGKPLFRSKVMIGGATLAVGTGCTKKESQQRAAKKVLFKIRNDDKYAQKLVDERAIKN